MKISKTRLQQIIKEEIEKIDKQAEDCPFKVGDIVEDDYHGDITRGEIVHVQIYNKKYWTSTGKDECGYIIKIIASPEEELIGRELEYDPSRLIDYNFTKVG